MVSGFDLAEEVLAIDLLETNFGFVGLSPFDCSRMDHHSRRTFKAAED
jgi:hypothetical protein